MTTQTWKPAFGAQLGDGAVRFAVWAPNASKVELELVGDGRIVPMTGDADGRFTVTVPEIGVGARYLYRLDGGDGRPDPYSRFQPEGVHGPSEVVDPSPYRWNDDEWTGISREGLVVYELHVGTMTPEGTFLSLIDQLPELKSLGVTAIELMPVAQCPGRWNWGYDGVNLFAPSNAYGRPDDLRALVDAAHEVGLGVILDVVYNHLGPEGNYLGLYADQYFSTVHETSWGAGLNWDGKGCEFVRQFAIDNACMWISEFHIDGLRLDATHAILDDSPVHILQELTARAREVAGEREIFIVAEDGRHEISRARAVEQGGEGLDAIWADDFHHEVRVHLTNAHENYYKRYNGSTTDIAVAINKGFGAVTTSRDDVTPVSDEDPASAFVFCIQNHDQVGNRPFGDRLHHDINADRYAVASALMLMAPETPLLFMGQEFAASTPFLYFTDHPEELGKPVTEGRRQEFSGFNIFDDPGLRESIPDPQAESTFLGSKLRLAERVRHAGVLELYKRLLALRQSDDVLKQNDRMKSHADAISAEIVVVHRWWGMQQRLLLANFGPEITITLRKNKILAPLHYRPWNLMLTTTDEAFGGNGELPVLRGSRGQRVITIPARSAALFAVGGVGEPVAGS